MVPLSEVATDASAPVPRLLGELADALFAKMDSADDPGLPDDVRDDIVEACLDLLQRAASIPAADHADVALKLEMLACCRCSDGPVDEELLDSALADAVRLSNRKGSALAPLFGCSGRTLAARLREIGVTVRPPGRRHLGNNASAIAPLAARGMGAKMPTRLDTQDWRASAEQMRGWAERTNDPETRRVMLRIATGYDKLADNIKESETRQRRPPSDE